MALEDIIEAIRLETDAQVEAVERDAAARAAAILAEGARAAASTEAELADARLEEAETAGDRIRNRARLEADRELRTAREAIVQRLFADAKERLRGLRRSEGYVAVFERLATEAHSVLSDATVAHVDPRDETQAAQILGAGIDIVADLEIHGGLVLSSPDGRTVHNTLELRLERAAPYLRRLLAELVPELGAPPS